MRTRRNNRNAFGSLLGDVQWIMKVEHSETVLMEEVPSTGGKPARWLIRQGQYITVGKLFVYGARRCSCWALYRIYKSLDIFIRKEQHSVSGLEDAVVLQNAKRKLHLDAGMFGLDW